MCCNENAVEYCKTCGNIGESCVEIHKTGISFKIHILDMYGKDRCNPRRIICDIRQEMCKHHPTEKTLIFCKTHNSLICGRCLQSDHFSYGEDDLAVCKDATHLDCDQANDTTAALYIIREITRDITRIKENVDQRKETNDTNMVKGNKELESLEIKLKRKVEDSIRGFSQETCTTNDKNLDANSMGSASPEMQMTRNELIEAFIQAKVDAEKAEMTMKELCDELKQVKHDLETSEKTSKQQCDELKQELDTSEMKRKILEQELLKAKQGIEESEKGCNELIESLNQAKLDVEKAETELRDELKQVKHGTETSEKTRQELCNELQLVKQDLYNSEKTRKRRCDELKQELNTSEKFFWITLYPLPRNEKLTWTTSRRKTFEKELLQANLVIEQAEKTRQELCDELEQVKQDLDHSEKKRKILEQELLKAKQGIEESEKTSHGLRNELKIVKQDLDNSEKTRKQQCDELKRKLDTSKKGRNELIESFNQAKLDVEKAETARKGFEKETLQAKQSLAKTEKVGSKTMKELRDELKQVKHDTETSEKTRQELCNELQLVKQDLYNSEKTRKQQCDELNQELDTSEKRRKTFEKELLQANLVIEQAEKTRQELCDEREQVKQDLDHSEKKRKILKQELLKAKQDIEESEKERAVVKAQLSTLHNYMKSTPIGTVKKTTDKNGWCMIDLVFKFPDGIQTTHHAYPGKTGKGGTFTGRLCPGGKGELLCRMLKAVFKRGLMFNVGKEGMVDLDGVSLYNGPVYTYELEGTYSTYTWTLKKELAAKGITEANINWTEKLEETFTVNLLQ
ncbi:myosin-9-like isoform X2 [Mya arenaria]|uniref:myosin-9-like isoform X2 n=1 Tax=Mya arenaria TaxID=6604 RepID=UPI0022DF0C85|nr:myosin-9-like isoform X2 [Mya arenaria]